MAWHECEGDDCFYCEQRIALAEHDRDFGYEDFEVPEYFDGT